MNHEEIENYINSEDEGLHSVIGASSSKRWLACPGSVKLSEKCKKPKTSSYAIEGTRAHRACELVLNGKIEAWELEGVKNVDSEMIDSVLIYEKHINSLLKPGGSIEIEKEFHLKELDERAFGTADAVVVNPTELHVVDFKYGKGVLVEVSEENKEDASGLDDDIPNNPQLMFYALGAFLNIKQKSKIKDIFIWVVQPRAHHVNGPIRYVKLTPEKLLEFKEILKNGMDETRNPNAALKVNPDCRWCPAFLQCPEQSRLTIKEAKMDFAEPHIELPEPKNLSPESISKVLENKPILETWFKSIYNYAKIEMEMGQKIPGFKLVNGRSSRSWINETEAVKYMGEHAYEKKVITPPQAEKIFGKLPENLVKKTVGLPTIALEGDKRKEYCRGTITDFDNETF